MSSIEIPKLNTKVFSSFTEKIDEDTKDNPFNLNLEERGLLLSMSIITLHSFIEEYLNECNLQIVQYLTKDGVTQEHMDYIEKQGRSNSVFLIRNMLAEMGAKSRFKRLAKDHDLKSKAKEFDEFRKIRNKIAHGTIKIADEYPELEERTRDVVDSMRDELKKQMTENNDQPQLIDPIVDPIIELLENAILMMIVFKDAIAYVAMFDAFLFEYLADNR